MIRYVETLMRANPVIGQLLRFAISGGISTVIYIAVYVPLTTWVWPGPESVYAVPFAFVVAVTAGFFLHSRWSFKGHGTGARGAAQQVQFVLVQASGMALNALITWIGTAKLVMLAISPFPFMITIGLIRCNHHRRARGLQVPKRLKHIQRANHIGRIGGRGIVIARPLNWLRRHMENKIWLRHTNNLAHAVRIPDINPIINHIIAKNIGRGEAIKMGRG